MCQAIIMFAQTFAFFRKSVGRLCAITLPLPFPEHKIKKSQMNALRWITRPSLLFICRFGLMYETHGYNCNKLAYWNCASEKVGTRKS